MTTHVGDGLYHRAHWRGPVPNETPGAMDLQDVMGVVLHVEQGTESGTDAWFHNPNAQASAHFGNPLSGEMDQFGKLTDKMWAEVAGNSLWWSIEHAGYSGKAPAPTPSQIKNDAHFLAFAHLHTDELIPLSKSDHPSERGLGWHGMGGAEWGGHLDCPGKRIIDSRGHIISMAKGMLHVAHTLPTLRRGSKDHEDVKRLQMGLNAVRHCKLTVDGDFGAKTEAQVDALKKAHGWPQNGIVGPRVWHLVAN